MGSQEACQTLPSTGIFLFIRSRGNRHQPAPCHGGKSFPNPLWLHQELHTRVPDTWEASNPDQRHQNLPSTTDLSQMTLPPVPDYRITHNKEPPSLEEYLLFITFIFRLHLVPCKLSSCRMYIPPPAAFPILFMHPIVC